MKRSLWLGVLVLLASCQQQRPRIVNHLPPELVLDFEAFSDAGCPPNQYGFQICDSDSPMAELGCDEIREPSKLLGALNSSYPIAICFVEPYRNAQEPGKANA